MQEVKCDHQIGETRQLKEHFFGQARLFEFSGRKATDVEILAQHILRMNRHGLCIDIKQSLGKELVFVPGSPRYLPEKAFTLARKLVAKI